jgi:ketosteroid isomerase-like protein
MCAFVVANILRAGEVMQQSDDATLRLADGRIVDGATYCASVLRDKWLPALVQFQSECSPEANRA